MTRSRARGNIASGTTAGARELPAPRLLKEASVPVARLVEAAETVELTVAEAEKALRAARERLRQVDGAVLKPSEQKAISEAVAKFGARIASETDSSKIRAAFEEHQADLPRPLRIHFLRAAVQNVTAPGRVMEPCS